MNLISVYQYKDAERILYELLQERDGDDTVNISHRKMPTWREHLKFVRSKPYLVWYLVTDGGQPAGATYLTKEGEIGIFLFKAFHGRGLGPDAVKELMKRTPRKRYLANINPDNNRSAEMFERLGFEPLQLTYVLRGT